MRYRFLPFALCLALLAAPLAAQEGIWTRIGPDGGHVTALAAAPSHPDRLYASLGAGGIAKSLDRGQTWILAGWPGLLNDLAVDPRTPNVIYGTGDFTLLRSVDGGTTWRILRRDAPEDRLHGVEVNPHNGVVFTFGQTYLFRSTDQGRTWMTRESWPSDMQALAFDPVRPNVIYAAGPQGLFRSGDGGRSWQPWGQGIPTGTALRTLAVDPHDPRTLWAGADNLSVGVFKSTDGGATWRPSQRGLRRREVHRIVVDPTRPSILHVLLRHGELFRSRDGGASWVASRGPGELVNDLDTLPYGLLAGTRTGISLSPDRGLTWRAAQRGLHGLAIDGLAIDSQVPPRLYAGTTQEGVFKTRDRGASWLRLPPVDDPLDWSRPVAVDPQDPETVYTSAGVSVARSTNGGRRWENHGALSCGIPEDIVIDPRDPGTLYTSGFIFSTGCVQISTTCLLARSLDAGVSWSCIQNGLPSILAKVLGVDPATSAVYVRSGSDLWRSTDQGETWSLVLEGFDPLSFAASPLAEGTLHVGGGQGRVARSADGGQTWTFAAVSASAGAVVGLALDPEDPQVVVAALVRGVFRSTDGGATWAPLGSWFQRWSIRSGPVLDPADSSIVYVGTGEVGVLRFDPTGE